MFTEETKTLESIGAHHGITRERVRQILKKMGVRFEDGRLHKAHADAKISRVALREKTRQEKREMQCLQITECTTEQYYALTGEYWLNDKTKTAKRYTQQKRFAMQRAVQWDLTFPQWWGIWAASGKYHLRGRHKYCYVMSRIGDTGPYALGNVKIITMLENVAEGWKNNPSTMRNDMALRALQVRIYRMRLEGKSHAQIAKELGVSVKTSIRHCVFGKKISLGATK